MSSSYSFLCVCTSSLFSRENTVDRSFLSCLDLNKLCYDFTCIHAGICTSNDNEGPRCDCVETAYIGERCDRGSCKYSLARWPRLFFVSVPNGFYFGKYNGTGSLEYKMAQPRQTDQDTITFGLQTLAVSAQIFRLESDSNLYSLEYEIVSLVLLTTIGAIRMFSSLGTRPIVYQIESRRKTTGDLCGRRSRYRWHLSCD